MMSANTGIANFLQLWKDGCDILSPRPGSQSSKSLLCQTLTDVKHKYMPNSEELLRFLSFSVESVGWDPVVGEACEAGHTVAVKWLLNDYKSDENETDVNTCGSIIDPFLHKASRSDNPDVVQVLLDAGLEINRTNDNHENALHAACHSSSASCAIHLIQAGIDINICDYAKRTPIFIAASRGLVNVVQALIEKGANTGQQCGRSFDWFSSFTPLHIAAHTNEINVIKILQECGAPLEARDKMGNTPLLTAVETSHCDAVKCLLDSGCDPHATCQRSFNALFKACFLPECIQLLKILFDSGLYDSTGGVNTRGPHGITLLMLAASVHVKMCKKDGRGKLLQFLLQAGADPGMKMDNKHFPFTALSFGVLGYNHRIEGKPDSYRENLITLVSHTPCLNVPCLVNLSYLELQGFPFKQPDPEKYEIQPPAFYAVKNCLEGLARILYTAGANINSCWLEECRNSYEYTYCQQSEKLLEHFENKIRLMSVWVQSVTSQPRCLQELCRLRVRTQLLPPMDCSVDQLPLPDGLKQYLMLPELSDYI